MNLQNSNELEIRGDTGVSVKLDLQPGRVHFNVVINADLRRDDDIGIDREKAKLLGFKIGVAPDEASVLGMLKDRLTKRFGKGAQVQMVKESDTVRDLRLQKGTLAYEASLSSAKEGTTTAEFADTVRQELENVQRELLKKTQEYVIRELNAAQPNVSGIKRSIRILENAYGSRAYDNWSNTNGDETNILATMKNNESRPAATKAIGMLRERLTELHTDSGMKRSGDTKPKLNIAKMRGKIASHAAALMPKYAIDGIISELNKDNPDLAIIGKNAGVLGGSLGSKGYEQKNEAGVSIMDAIRTNEEREDATAAVDFLKKHLTELHREESSRKR